MHSFLKKLNNIFAQRSIATSIPFIEEMDMEESVYENYAYIIGSVFTYFNDLPPELKRKFIKRAYQFRKLKKFHYIGVEHSEDTAILVSSSAVQVTFGLKNYQLAFFKDIYILADAYHMDNDNELYVGHVAPDGIYLSWKHFLYGYSYKNDNVNVAVHEMSHALLYNNYFAQFGGDSNFRLNYEKFSLTTGPILADVITNRRSYLRNYAFTNMHEFWAVSVEAFFENPVGLRQNMPDLYDSLCKVLNQDPSTSHKILVDQE
ncbi:MAG: zinc-dependent peptidase [Chitinophagaceae bacterium]